MVAFSIVNSWSDTISLTYCLQLLYGLLVCVFHVLEVVGGLLLFLLGEGDWAGGVVLMAAFLGRFLFLLLEVDIMCVFQKYSLRTLHRSYFCQFLLSFDVIDMFRETVILCVFLYLCVLGV